MWTRDGVAMLVALACLAGCRNEMYDQAKTKPLSESEFFANGQSARPIPPDTVARGFLREGRKGQTHAARVRTRNALKNR